MFQTGIADHGVQIALQAIYMPQILPFFPETYKAVLNNILGNTRLFNQFNGKIGQWGKQLPEKTVEGSLLPIPKGISIPGSIISKIRHYNGQMLTTEGSLCIRGEKRRRSPLIVLRPSKSPTTNKGAHA